MEALLVFVRPISQHERVTPRRGTIRAAIALLAALLIVGSYATPAAAAAGIRAAKCCAEHCAKPRSAPAARHCCPSLRGGAEVDAAAVSATAGIERPLASPAVISFGSQRPADGSTSSVRAPASPRAVPI